MPTLLLNPHLIVVTSEALDEGLEGDALLVVPPDVLRGDVPLAVGAAHVVVLGVVLLRPVVHQLMGKVADEVALRAPEMQFWKVFQF